MIGGCPRREELPAFHDGGASAALRGSMERHLLVCRECADRLAQMEAVDALLLRCRPHPEPLEAGEAKALFQRAVSASGVKTRARGWGSWRWQRQIAGLAAVGIAVAVLAHGMGGARPEVAGLPAEGEQPGTRMSSTPAGFVRERNPGEVEQGPTAAPVARPRLQWAASRRKRAHRWGGFRPRRKLRLAAPLPDTAPVEARTEESPEPVLLVSVTHPPALSVTVTQADPGLPGFARAEALELTPTGNQVLTAVTVSSCAIQSPEDSQNSAHEESPRVQDEKESSDETR